MKLQLSLRASDLKNAAGIGRGTSDPFAVVTHMDTTSTVLGKTETIKNTLDPDWAKVFVFDYELGTPMHVAVSLYDEVRKGENISMGSVLFDVGSLLGAYGNTKGKTIKRGGVVFARVGKFEENGTMRLKLKGIKLKNTEGFLRKSDPFFELKTREDSDGVGTSWDSVFRSKTVKDNLSPIWSDAVVSLGTLCHGNMDRPIKICVYDYESSGEHVLMGELETTVNNLVIAKEQEEDGALSLRKKGSESGKIVVLKADIYGVENLSDDMAAASVSDDGVRSSIKAKTPTFIEYISGGCELNLCVAIDFTGSNGDPRIPGTLHFRHADGSKNDYEKAISAIGSILEKYDSNQKFPVYGFGAKFSGVVRHCFQCGPIQEVDGVGGVLSAYQEVFRSGLIMSGPTVFTEVILTSAKKAADAQVRMESS
uniref:C2 domain-containing protein n=1 Tax=Attheya septentrionalis TaxID=420275 RepID=A0A7S2XS77_9STRA|mmetsp:Transcript_6833/g.12266  ORF Transcript_6833/g.12266 Transcript_6833/m.12266 type:complete len:424 (+) Transcript_6833:95-1366(+)